MTLKPGQWIILRHPVTHHAPSKRPALVKEVTRTSVYADREIRGQVRKCKFPHPRVMAVFDTRQEAESFCTCAFALLKRRNMEIARIEDDYTNSIRALGGSV